MSSPTHYGVTTPCYLSLFMISFQRITILVTSLFIGVMCSVYFLINRTHHNLDYDVYISINDDNFGPFDHVYLDGIDILSAPPYSFESFLEPRVSSAGATALKPLLPPAMRPIIEGDHHDIHHFSRRGTIRYLYLERNSAAEKSLYAWLKSQQQQWQGPKKIDLVLIKKGDQTLLTRGVLDVSTRGAASDNHFVGIKKISLYASIPVSWSLESHDYSPGHYYESILLSYKNLSWWAVPDDIDRQGKSR
ncbi:MAG: hypothetical protein OXC40_04890 [Proteobacteria bacterium]|nr:hypothetical protein [Pseudomonadota bacterium]